MPPEKRGKADMTARFTRLSRSDRNLFLVLILAPTIDPVKALAYPDFELSISECRRSRSILMISEPGDVRGEAGNGASGLWGTPSRWPRSNQHTPPGMLLTSESKGYNLQVQTTLVPVHFFSSSLPNGAVRLHRPPPVCSSPQARPKKPSQFSIPICRARPSPRPRPP